ncbi:hypothetical protein QTP88_024506 [Uroleucon formosanum]
MVGRVGIIMGGLDCQLVQLALRRADGDGPGYYECNQPDDGLPSVSTEQSVVVITSGTKKKSNQKNIDKRNKGYSNRIGKRILKNTQKIISHNKLIATLLKGSELSSLW